jgi:DNA-binding NtrC family response regulator
VRELRNLVESMVVLSPGREIRPDDLPRQIREGGSARWLPVPVGPLVRAQAAATTDGRELEFILRSLLELRLQVEDLRRQAGVGSGRVPTQWVGEVGSEFIGEVPPPSAFPLPTSHSPLSSHFSRGVSAIAPRDAAPPPNVVTVEPGTKMSDIERRVIEAALKESRGNRRRAAEMLGIGERTLYRKIKEYKVPEELFSA